MVFIFVHVIIIFFVIYIDGLTTINVPGMGDSITNGTIVGWQKSKYGIREYFLCRLSKKSRVSKDKKFSSSNDFIRHLNYIFYSIIFNFSLLFCYLNFIFIEKGDYVNVDDVLVVIETDKVSVDVRAPTAGILEETLANQGDNVNVGAPLAKIKAGAKGSGAPAPAPAPTPAPAAKTTSAPAPAPTPVTVSSPPPKAPAPAPAPKPAAASPPKAPTGSRTENRVKMTRMRQRISQRLKESQNTAAMLTTFQECDMTSIFETREKYKDAFEKKHGVKLGFMSAFLKAAASSLTEMPIVNAVIDGGDIVYRDYVDISVAVASPRGLVVPVVRNVEGMDFSDIEKTLAELAVKARNDQIAIEDMAGGTFTVSNGGVFGSLMGTPIINPPQSAILGMHATKMRPVAINGKVEIRPIMYLALTYDHRLIDGREAVTFLASVRDKVEDPRRLLLGL